MSRPKIVGSLALILCWASMAFGQDPPPLEAPASEPETPKAATSRPKPQATTPTPAPNATARPNPRAAAAASVAPAIRANQPVSPGSQVRPMLVIPGVTGPGSRPRALDRPGIPQPSRPPNAAAAGRRESAPLSSAPSQGQSPFREVPGQSATRPGLDPLDEPIPMSIEPLDDVPDSDAKPKSSTAPNVTRDRSRPGSSRAGNSADERPPASARPRPAPRLLPGMLGRMLQPGQAQARDRAELNRSGEKARQKDASEPEAVTDASVKRKIEKEIRETLGDRVRSVEVRVSGRNILIVARATRFWQKRTVRRVLETLPALDGYRARIDLDD